MPQPNQPLRKPRSIEKKLVWSPVGADDRFEVRLAEGSIVPMSQMALRDLALKLKQLGAIDVYHLLDWLGVPDADEIATAVENEMKLAALAKVTRK